MSGSTTGNAPKVTVEQIEATIDKEFYYTAEQGANASGGNAGGALTLLTHCTLLLKNGFIATGTSAAASPENFDAEKGKTIARAKAVDQMWVLLGYELKTDLARFLDKDPPSQPDLAPHTYVNLGYSKPMKQQAYMDLTGSQALPGTQPTDDGYIVEAPGSGAPNAPGYENHVFWYAKAEFEAAWKPVGGVPYTPGTGTGPDVSRLTQERNQLQSKITKLQAFLVSSAASDISMADRMDLNDQLSGMNAYFMALSRRVNKLTLVMPTVTPVAI